MRVSRFAVIAAIAAACPTQAKALPADLHYAALTAVFEASSDGVPGMAAVLATIHNRVICGYGPSIRAVVTHRHAFEVWTTKRAAIMALPSSNWSYQRALWLAELVWTGEHRDPTGGATHYWSPSVQAGFGRAAPAWASQYERTAQIGHHVFYRGPCRPGGDAADAAPTPTVARVVRPVSAPQVRRWQAPPPRRRKPPHG